MYLTLWSHGLSSPGSLVHWILQVRILEWVAILFSGGSSWPKDWSWVSSLVSRFFTTKPPNSNNIFFFVVTNKFWNYNTWISRFNEIWIKTQKQEKKNMCKPLIWTWIWFKHLFVRRLIHAQKESSFRTSAWNEASP